MKRKEFDKKFIEDLAKKHKLLPYQVELLKMHMKHDISRYTIMGRRVGRLR